MSDEFKLRLLPSRTDLVPLKVSAWERKIDSLTSRILIARGLDPVTCPNWFFHEALHEAKQRLGPRPLIS